MRGADPNFLKARATFLVAGWLTFLISSALVASDVKLFWPRECSASFALFDPSSSTVDYAPGTDTGSAMFESGVAESTYYDLLNSTRSVLETHLGSRRSFRYAGKGGESIAYRLTTPRGRSFAVSVPRDPMDTRVENAYFKEASWVANARLADPEGARHLLPIHRVFRMGEGGVAKLSEFASVGTLYPILKFLGPDTPPRFMLDLWRQIALGARALHRSERVHRDIKPSNVFVTTSLTNLVKKPDGSWGTVREGTLHALEASDLTLKLGDLGLSEVAGDPVETLGSFGHMDLAQRMRANANYRSDLYALSVTFKEMQAGRSVLRFDESSPENGFYLSKKHHIKHSLWLRLPDRIRERSHEAIVKVTDREYGSIDELIGQIDSSLDRLSSKNSFSGP